MFYCFTMLSVVDLVMSRPRAAPNHTLLEGAPVAAESMAAHIRSRKRQDAQRLFPNFRPQRAKNARTASDDSETVARRSSAAARAADAGPGSSESRDATVDLGDSDLCDVEVSKTKLGSDSLLTLRGVRCAPGPNPLLSVHMSDHTANAIYAVRSSIFSVTTSLRLVNVVRT